MSGGSIAITNANACFLMLPFDEPFLVHKINFIPEVLDGAVLSSPAQCRSLTLGDDSSHISSPIMSE
jgi:hypothetical protein